MNFFVPTPSPIGPFWISQIALWDFGSAKLLVCGSLSLHPSSQRPKDRNARYKPDDYNNINFQRHARKWIILTASICAVSSPGVVVVDICIGFFPEKLWRASVLDVIHDKLPRTRLAFVYPTHRFPWNIALLDCTVGSYVLQVFRRWTF